MLTLFSYKIMIFILVKLNEKILAPQPGAPTARGRANTKEKITREFSEELLFK